MPDNSTSSLLSKHRAAGILLHLTSLPSSWGIGDLGPEAENFLDFLKKSGQSYWQFLPLGPTCAIHGHSPYMSTSAFAGNPLLISPDLLLRDGWIDANDIADKPDFYQYLVRFDEVVNYKEILFERAFARLQNLANQPAAFTQFCTDNLWLDNYTLYVALSEKFTGKPWFEWPEKFARRDPEALKTEARKLKERISYHKFIQFLLAEQWCEKVYIHDLENGLPNNTKASYDCAICSHVLEHICYPQQLLEDIQEKIVPGGLLIIAVPNLLFWKNRLQLSLGRFEYTDTGLMDYTHVRWYTLDSLSQLIENYGFKTIHGYGTGNIPLPLRRLVGNRQLTLDLWAARKFPGLFAHQLILVARKASS